MAGFLNNLQKQKGKVDMSVGELLTSSEEESSSASASTAAPAPESKPSPPAVTPEEYAARVSEAEQLLADLMQESTSGVPHEPAPPMPTPPVEAAPAQASEPSSEVSDNRNAQKIVRRNKTPKSGSGLAGKIEDKLPWWLTDGKNTTPQIEALVPQARKMLNEILPADANKKMDMPDAVRQAVSLASDVLGIELRITEKDREHAVQELLELLTGKGPLQPLYDDPAVTDVFVDSHNSIKVIRKGQAIETPFYFRSKEEYKAFVNGMLQSVDRTLNLSSPIVDCVLDDGFRSRINAVDSSVIDGEQPRICIRIPRLQRISFYDILQSKTLPATVAAWLAEVIATGEANIMILGPTGSGKTVFTTALLSAVGSDERIITIEDVPEIFVPSSHLEKLVSRPANAQGEGEVKMPQLLRAALRRAPHRIVVGEIRDEEGRLFLRALETGHAGSIATIHAENARDSLWRLLDVVSAYEAAPQESIMRRIARSLHMVITMRKVEGKPCLVDISEVCPPVDGEFVVQPIVQFDSVKDAKRHWRLMTNHSYWMDKIAKRGLELRPGPGLLGPEQPGKPGVGR